MTTTRVSPAPVPAPMDMDSTPSALLALAAQWETSAERGGFHWDATPSPAEAPLPEPEGERVETYRQGHGWVERPAVELAPEIPALPQRESAAAA